MDKSKLKLTRKSKHDKLAPQVKQLRQEGYTVHSICEALGIHINTYYRLMRS